MTPLEIGASLANEAASEASLNSGDATYFIFGNSDNPETDASDTPTQTATTTATTALPGGVASTSVPVSNSTPGLASTSSSSLGIIELLALAALAFLLIHHFLKK
jgi:hypothetical protein